MGTVHSVLPLGEAHIDAYMLSTSNHPTLTQMGASDEWFVDDGQAFVRPDLADRWLRTATRHGRHVRRGARHQVNS